MATLFIRFITILCVSLYANQAFSKDYIIYTISQDIPMGEPNEVLKKNYYVNFGKQQGLTKGTKLDVYRQISRLDPYETKVRFDHNVKIGELVVLHSEENTAITAFNSTIVNTKDSPYFDLRKFMIGDKVKVNISGSN